MPWFKVDDAFHCHPKVMRAGTSALGLWARCGSWAAQQLTDGFVPTDVALMYGTKSQVKALISAGLWSDADGGYQFHDWSPINPTREQVLADREAAKERQRRARDAAESRRKSRVSHGVTDAELQALSQPPQPNPTHTEGSNEPRNQDPPRIDVEQACARLAEWIERNGSKKPAVSQGWRDAARLMLDRDCRTLDESLRLIDWCQRSEFWRANILSMPKFREKYDQMRLQAVAQSQASPERRVGAHER